MRNNSDECFEEECPDRIGNPCIFDAGQSVSVQNLIMEGLPFPQCVKHCQSIGILGSGECEATCPDKFIRVRI